LALAAETVTYYYTDVQGTPLVTTGANGIPVTTNDYHPYGEGTLGTSQGGPGYVGHIEDADAQLIYMQARYFDPVIGRFLGVDPDRPMSGNPMEFSRYSYAANNPINNVDLFGEACGGNGEVSSKTQGMRDLSDHCNSGGGGGEGPYIPISDAEAQAADSGDVAKFWYLRYSGTPRDPWSADGVALWNPSVMDDTVASLKLKALAYVNLDRLDDTIRGRDGTYFSQTGSTMGEIRQIGVEVMNAYVSITNRNEGHIPSLAQSTAFHYDIFKAHNLPSGVYGGTPLGYGPTGAMRNWGDFQAGVLNQLTGYCSPGCVP
jgi:RHS repeat-associated protein